jgi:hypothetical protein
LASSVVSRRVLLLVALLLGAAFVASASASRARADTPAHTDVMFVFDTTGSMGSALGEAKAQIQEAMTQIGASLPDVQFGLAEMRDYSEVNFNGFPEEIEYEEGYTEEFYDIGSGFQPWTLDVPITANQSAVAEAILDLEANGGGDGPEAYGRALYETDGNPAVGWRPGARSVIVLVADNVPHDNDLNVGIPEELWAEESPFYTSPDPGPDNTLGTADDLDWQDTVLSKLLSDGKPLEYVDYFGYPPYFPYWQNWTARTGGSAVESGGEGLSETIVEVVKAGASAALPACPPGQVRDSNEHCVPAPSSTPTSTPSPPAPPAPPSNHFKFEPRISCASGCHVVLVKITFDSDGNVIGESIPEEEGKASALISKRQARHGKHGKHKKKRPPLVRKFHQSVHAGVNALKLKLTRRALKILHKRHKLKLEVRFRYTPTGGTTKVLQHTYQVKLPRKKHHRHH